MGKYKKFNIKEITKTLFELKSNFDSINYQLVRKKEKLSDTIIENIIETYQYINELLDKDIELFSSAGLYSMAELNHIVLCGTKKEKRIEYHKHIVETREKFQKNIKPIFEWYKKESKEKEISPFKLASGFYVKALSQPQLFIEGNHRTENVIMNYILVSFGKPPFILSTHNAIKYFEPSAQLKVTSKENFMSNIREIPNLKKEIKKLLEKYVDEKYIY
ncbi:MAG: hypothetical protein A2086_07480 [Spirochaetes bacterium GWD1_27_9]|nr:MAG: hypothetical protein A2Z98_18125 [Spirochaetes bacterium GWB1_27_13]OHD27948.1 MAG: hypothetical protein A2Y34_13315 [Spirochaetes bacterium GWC1_27_15]OHD44774.1 MAG: hypothetical protein A2086_07480 [Spirochaetes bacterium GWD1_27_9]